MVDRSLRISRHDVHHGQDDQFDLVRRTRSLPTAARLALAKMRNFLSQASPLIGDKGKLLIRTWRRPALPEIAFAEFKFELLPAREHCVTWADACRGMDKTTSPFSYAGPLSETVLLGTAAIRVPNQTLAWDAQGWHSQTPRQLRSW